MKTILKIIKYGIFLLGLIILLSFISGFINGIFSSSKEEKKEEAKSVVCTKKEPYKLSPEFERARSLRIQRMQESGFNVDFSWYNCINIVYSDLEGSEGMFKFDEKSSLDNLTVYVDNSYKSKDDLLTAMLLSHEFTHLNQFIEKATKNTSLSCVESEIAAHKAESLLFSTFNMQEKLAIVNRVRNIESDSYSDARTLDTLKGIKDILEFDGESIQYCKKKYKQGSSEFANCWNNYIDLKLREYITSNKAYITQCHL